MFVQVMPRLIERTPCFGGVATLVSDAQRTQRRLCIINGSNTTAVVLQNMF